MARRVFFSFEYAHDATRAMVVRNSWVTQGKEDVGFIDKAEFEKLQRTGDLSVKRWIDNQLQGTSVTVVLVGSHTCSSKWVRYEIEESARLGKGLLGINISKIPDLSGRTSTCCGRRPRGYPFYRWVENDGYNNMGGWIEKAAKAAGR